MTETNHSPSWPRRYHQEGGGDATLFFVVYGEMAELPELDRARYRCAAVPDELTITGYGPEVHPEVLEQFLEGYLWEALLADQPQLAEEISTSPHCSILRGEFPDGADLDYLRNTIGLISFLLDHGGRGVYDPLGFRWWSPEDWRAQVFDIDEPAPLTHAVILASDEQDSLGTWYHTRGMRKFGRPDLSIHNVTEGHAGPVADMLERFIQWQALGGVIAEGYEIHMPPLPPGMTCRHGGDTDDPDFNNQHVEIRWPQ